MDYAMLSRLQIQSMTDQENYLKLPAILVGASAAVLPEQLAIWSYPLPNADADQASFNMVTAMMCRIHQSGRLDALSPVAGAQVAEGIRVYRDVLRNTFLRNTLLSAGHVRHHQFSSAPRLGNAFPRTNSVGVWRIDGPAVMIIPIANHNAKLIYPTDLGITVTIQRFSPWRSAPSRWPREPASTIPFRPTSPEAKR